MKAGAILCLALAGFSLAAHAQVFKWVDEKGRTHYGEKPPAGIKGVEVDKPTPPSDPTRQPLSAEEQQRRQRLATEHMEKLRADPEAAERERRAIKCRFWRRELEVLDNEKLRLLREMEAGYRTYPTPEERDLRRIRVQREIRENCAD